MNQLFSRIDFSGFTKAVFVVLVVSFWLAMPAGAQTITENFTSSGTFEVPEGVTSVVVRCWGGGGGGASLVSNRRGGGGGGGGAFASKTILVTPLTAYDYVVGAAGAASSAGGKSYFGNLLVVAVGGSGGAYDATTAGAGGSEISCTGDTVKAGGAGGTGRTSSLYSYYSGGGGGAAYNTAVGGSASYNTPGTGYFGVGAAGVTSGKNGLSAVNYASGGSGASNSSAATRTGGSGAAGYISVTYFVNPYKVISSQGTPTAYYKTLSEVFGKINDGTHMGDIEIILLANSLNNNTTATLNASGTGNASYTSVHLYPSKDGLTIGGSVAGSLISLYGADKVSIDGRVGGAGSTSSLVVSNTNASGTALYFGNSASNNCVAYVTLKASGANTPVIHSYIDSNGEGNDNDTITNCVVTSGSTRAYCGLLISGSNTTSPYDGFLVLNNEFYNVWNASVESSGVRILSNSENITVSGNSFYESGTFTPTAATAYYGIMASNTSINALTVSNNYIGGSAAQCSGTLTMGSTSYASLFFPVSLVVGTTTASSVQGNTIKGIAQTSSSTTPFTAINVGYNGLVNVTGNTIGATSGTGSIIITSAVASATSCGISLQSASDGSISDNNIGGITVATSNSLYGHHFYGIYKSWNSGTMTFSNNLIGSLATSGSIRATSVASSNAQSVVGIHILTTGVSQISGNTIANLLNGSTTSSSNKSVYGIEFVGASSAVNTMSSNFIYNLSSSSTGTANQVTGILMNTGMNTCYNNIVNLGGNTTGLYSIIGIQAVGSQTEYYYHNTVYLSGSITGSTSIHTAAFYKSTTNGTVYLKNNILYNARSGGSGTGRHSSVYLIGTGGFNSDNNTYYAPNTNGVLGILSSTSYSTLSDWQTATVQDASTGYLDPLLTNAGSSNVNDYYPLLDNVGEDLSSVVTTDYLGTARTQFPTIGAFERPLSYNIEVYNGSTYLAHYVTLKKTFEKINDGTHTGHLTIKISGNLVEKKPSFLHASGTATSAGTSNYSSIEIYPTVSGLTLSGHMNSSFILLSGAKNVTFDGRVNATGSTPDLTIINENQVGVNATTFTLDSTAQSNTLKYLIIKGGGGSSTNATVLFGPEGNNSDNIVSHCELTNNGVRRVNAVYSATGTNTGNQLIGNAIYNNWLTSATSYAVNLDAGNSGWTLTGNSIYDSEALTSTGNFNYYGICISNTSGTGFTLSGNFIGGSSAKASGTPLSLTNTVYEATTLYPIYLNVGAAAVSSVQGNKINNISLSLNRQNPFYGIYVNAGKVNVGTTWGNVIGSHLGVDSILVNSTYYQPSSYALYVASTDEVNVANNVIGSITVSSTSSTSHSFAGIYKSAVAGRLSVKGNLIGSTATSSSIKASSTGSSYIQSLFGIYNAGTGSVLIKGNTIANLTNSTTSTQSLCSVNGIYSVAGTDTISENTIYGLSIANNNTSTSQTASVTGIAVTATVRNVVNDNIIYSLSNTNASFTGAVIGLYFSGGTANANTVERNFIRDFSFSATGAKMIGINIGAGATTFANNLVSFNSTVAGTMYGILETGASSATTNLYFNTVRLAGSLTSGSTALSYALYCASSSNTRIFKNNLLVNTRSTSLGSNKHFAIYYAGGTQSGLTSNYNDYIASGTGGVIGYYNGANKTTYVVVTGQDANSKNVAPSFLNVGGSYALASDFKPDVNLVGTPVADYATDYGLKTRSLTVPTIGAWEYFASIDLYIGTTLTASFKTLKLAFDAINAGTHKGVLTLRLNNSTSETATATLNASGSGSASYSCISIYPTSSDVIVSGSIAGPLISLYGADNVCVDGRVNATGTEANLVLSNTNVGTSSVTLLLDNTAQSDTISYCKIKGGGGSLTNATNATVQFGTTGTNSGNLLSNCYITNNGTRRLHAILSVTGVNTGNTVQNCRFYDNWSTAATSHSVYLGAGATDWTISGNHFYQTAAITPTGAYSYYDIYITNTSGTGFVVSDNFMGGRADSCQGVPFTLGSTSYASVFNPIYLNVGASATSSVDGNVIRNIAQTSSNTTSPFKAIQLDAGAVNMGSIQGNTIGDTTTTSSILLTTSAAAPMSYGIYLNSTGAVRVDNNRIGSIMTTGSSTSYAHGFSGIYKTATAGDLTIANNMVGSSVVEKSIEATSPATGNSQFLYGIYSLGSGAVTISGNTVRNLMNSTTETGLYSKLYGIYTNNGVCSVLNNKVMYLTTGGAASSANYENAPSVGIYSASTASSQKIMGNLVCRLTNLSTSKVELYGIFYQGTLAGVDTIANNFVHSYRVGSTVSTSYLHGLSMYGTSTYTGTLTVLNNVVYIGDSISVGCNIFGIVKNLPKAVHFYHNTIYLKGTVADGSTTTSFSFRERTASSTSLHERDIRNNIFWNARSGGGSNYAVHMESLDNLKIDYNDYGWSGTYFAEISTADYVTLDEWLTTTQQDTSSLTIDPQFINPGGFDPADYKTFIGLDGAPGLGVTTDYANHLRSTGNPTMGAWECFPVDLYNGETYRNSFFTLKNAFDAINDGVYTGEMVIKMKGSTTETSTAVLNASGTGLANYSNVLIYPTRSKVHINGNLDSYLLQLNGADKVTIDGRIDTTGVAADMTLSNQSAGTSAGTIQFSESAQNNTLYYCTIRGAGSSAAQGVVDFSTASSGTGNDHNSIKNCIITGTSLSSRPVNAVYSSGTTGMENSENTLSENQIINNWRIGSSSYSVNLGDATTGWTLTGNSFYDTTAFVPTGAYTYSALYINGAANTGHIITGNYIGGRLPQALGSALTVGSTTQGVVLYPIYLNVGSASPTSVQGNIITNTTLSSSATNPFAGIYVASGDVHIGTSTANTLGAVTGTSAVSLTSSATNALSYGLYLNGAGKVVASNNKIGSVKTASSSTVSAHGFYGIYTAGSGVFKVSENLLGSLTTTGSIQTSNVSTGQEQVLAAIYSASTGTDTISGNTIYNLTNSSTYNVAGNLVGGVYHGSTGYAFISENYIYNLSSAATGTANVLSGIHLNAGSSSCVNNVINLGSSSLGYPILYGIYNKGVNGYSDSIYHNTVYLAGTVSGTASAAKSYAFYKSINAGTTHIKNNIFCNARSNGSAASKHYAIYLPGTGSLTIDGNDYYVTGTYGVMGNMSGTDIPLLNNWITATSQDASSRNIAPGFTNQGGTTALDYKLSSVLSGVAGTGVLTDFGNNVRESIPSMGAWEYALCVEVYNGSTLLGAYLTLQNAFDQINSGVHTGDLKVRICKSTYETATAALNASGSGGTFTHVLVYPAYSNIMVEGSMNAPLINLNGADHVVIDGRVDATGSTPSLILSNTNAGTSATTVQFAESAQYDTLQYCYVKGAGLGSTAGTVHFATASTGTGNSYNVVSSCHIAGVSSSERPANALYSAGTSGKSNTANIIRNNNFYNFLVPGTASNGILIASNSTHFSLTDNSFYGTDILTSTSAVEYAFVRIDNTSGDGFVLNGNYFGGNAPECSGVWTKTGNNNAFYGMYLNVGGTTATSVQNNFIRNISYTNSGNADWTGIHVASGLVDIGTENGNVLGSASGLGALTITNGVTGGNVYGIHISSANTVNCQNNVIASLTAATSSSSLAHNIYAVYKASAAGTTTINGNTIGSASTSNSVNASSTSYQNSQLVYGIYSLGTGAVTISNNVIANVSNSTTETTKSSQIGGIFALAGSNTISNNLIHDLFDGGAANGGTNALAPNIGIYVLSSTAGQTLSGNSIYRLTNNQTAKIYAYGIYYNGPATGTNIIAGNFIHRMNMSKIPPESYIHGMAFVGGTGTAYNNLISLGDSLTVGCTIYGLLKNNVSAMQFYQNTVYIGGNVAAAVSATNAFRDETASPTGVRNIRNNLFSNSRSGGGTHYSIYLTSLSNLTIDYNAYYAAGTNGVLGYSAGNITTLPAWKTATSQDVNSLNVDPIFVYAGTTNSSDYTPTATLSGVTGLGISTDFSGAIRSVPPTMGAFEFQGYYWTGTVDTEWAKPGNWLPQMVPTLSVRTLIPNRTNDPQIKNGVTAEVNSMIIYSGAVVTIDGGGSLRVASTLSNDAGKTGLVILSTSEGTGSLICDSANVAATVKRYIDGDTCAWHFLSSPVDAQEISGTWKPSGTYGDGTGYDLYVWDEPASCWIYNLNSTVAPTWTTAHPESSFVPGRGYLYAVQALHPTKQFAGNLNAGNISYPLTITGTGDYQGFNLIGNPYPSSIDWQTATGFDRSMLYENAGGYDIWTWSPTANNYGVYNSADADAEGTNNVTRYIAPMQGFFVCASSAGNFVFKNAARTHTGANVWLKSATAPGQNVRLVVESGSGLGRDEVKMGFGYTGNEGGALKLFSPVKTAPSLFVKARGLNYSTRQLTDTLENRSVPVSFTAGESGTYSLHCNYDEDLFGILYLEDRLTGLLHNLSRAETYTFTAHTDDSPNRFVLHFGSLSAVDDQILANVYINKGKLTIDLDGLNGNFDVRLTDLEGRQIWKTKMVGGEQCSVDLSARGLYVVSIQNASKSQNIKVVY
jgi:hypothetical protein